MIASYSLLWTFLLSIPFHHSIVLSNYHYSQPQHHNHHHQVGRNAPIQPIHRDNGQTTTRLFNSHDMQSCKYCLGREQRWNQLDMDGLTYVGLPAQSILKQLWHVLCPMLALQKEQTKRKKRAQRENERNQRQRERRTRAEQHQREGDVLTDHTTEKHESVVSNASAASNTSTESNASTSSAASTAITIGEYCIMLNHTLDGIFREGMSTHLPEIPLLWPPLPLLFRVLAWPPSSHELPRPLLRL